MLLLYIFFAVVTYLLIGALTTYVVARITASEGVLNTFDANGWFWGWPFMLLTAGILFVKELPDTIAQAAHKEGN